MKGHPAWTPQLPFRDPQAVHEGLHRSLAVEEVELASFGMDALAGRSPQGRGGRLPLLDSPGRSRAEHVPDLEHRRLRTPAVGVPGQGPQEVRHEARPQERFVGGRRIGQAHAAGISHQVEVGLRGERERGGFSEPGANEQLTDPAAKRVARLEPTCLPDPGGGSTRTATAPLAPEPENVSAK